LLFYIEKGDSQGSPFFVPLNRVFHAFTMRFFAAIAFMFSVPFFGLYAQNEIASFYFNVGKSVPTDSSLQALAKFKTMAQGNDDFTIEIVALYSYTDSTGTRAINDRLATERLNYVKKYLDPEEEWYNVMCVPATLERKSDAKDVLNWRRVDVYYSRVYFVVEEIVEEVPSESLDELFKIEKEEDVSNSSNSEHAQIHDEMKKFIDRNEPYILNINFIPGTYQMEPGSSAVLNVLATYLFQHSELNVVIRGHVCCENNKRASKKRAQAVVKRLVEMGVDKSRLKAIGMSNSEPLVSPERTESDRQKNRRVDAQFVSPNKP
jgi:outer membrane protein OmpA-like peptidoglycan-associated protein